MQELRKSSAATGLFTSITDEQIDAAKQEALLAAQQPQIPGEGLPGGEAQPMQGMEMQQMPMQTMDAWTNDKGNKNSGNHNHAGRPNQVGGSAPSGGGGTAQKGNASRKQGTGARKDLTGKSTAHNYGSTSGKNKFKGFTKTRLEQHGMYHMAETGATNMLEYQKKAKDFGSQPVGGNIVGCRDGEGNIVRYDKERCILLTGNPQTGFIHVLFFAHYAFLSTPPFPG